MDSEEVFLDDVLERCAIGLRRGTSLAIRTDIHPCYVVGDAETLQQMVRILIDNAARRASSTIDLTVYREDARAVLIIGEDGASNDGAAAFASRPGNESSNPGSIIPAGCGDDLELVDQIVAHHNGTITIDHSHTGTAVTVTLPSSRLR